MAETTAYSTFVILRRINYVRGNMFIYEKCPNVIKHAFDICNSCMGVISAEE